MATNAKSSMQAGLNFLAGQQLANGSFASDSSPSTVPWQPSYHYLTTFVPSLILTCLAAVPATESTRQKLSQFLLTQQSPGGSFNYWQNGSPENAKFPYPDDLDDTFCALIGLCRHNPSLVDEKILAQAVHLLITNETKPGGPYRTWLTTKTRPVAWQNIDLAVNANIAYFLKLVGSPSPPLLSYLETQIEASNYASDFYPSPYPVWYYLARVCPANSQVQLRQTILKALPANPMQTALALSALRQLKANPRQLKPLEQVLLKAQNSNGSWSAAAFCLDPTRQGQKHYHGSVSLTTALALEALNPSQAPPNPVQKPHDNTADYLQSLIVKQTEADIALLAPDLQRSAKRALQKLLTADYDHKITLLPHYFGNSLKEANRLDSTFYTRLGRANLYGWLAYTIYDDFIDEEGRPPLLPVANWAMRQSLNYFRLALPKDHAFQNRVSQTFTVIDEANAWELAHCRSPQQLPDYGKLAKLAERSLGHTLAPQAILAKLGYNLNGDLVWAVRQALQHYLIARQLDDDAHDWITDFAQGHISYVVSQILRGVTQPTPIKMQQQFWRKTLPQVCQTMQKQLKLARLELTNCPIFKSDNYLVHLLDQVERSASSSLAKQSQAANFLTAYRGKVTK